MKSEFQEVLMMPQMNNGRMYIYLSGNHFSCVYWMANIADYSP